MSETWGSHAYPQKHVQVVQVSDRPSAPPIDCQVSKAEAIRAIDMALEQKT